MLCFVRVLRIGFHRLHLHHTLPLVCGLKLVLHSQYLLQTVTHEVGFVLGSIVAFIVFHWGKKDSVYMYSIVLACIYMHVHYYNYRPVWLGRFKSFRSSLVCVHLYISMITLACILHCTSVYIAKNVCCWSTHRHIWRWYPLPCGRHSWIQMQWSRRPQSESTHKPSIGSYMLAGVHSTHCMSKV